VDQNNQNLVKSIILGNSYPNLVFLTIIFEPETLESRSKAEKTQILAKFPLKN